MAPKGWCWPISRARSLRKRMRRPFLSPSFAATGSAWRRYRARCHFLLPMSRYWNSRPGTVCRYDRVSPNAVVVAQRMTALSRLARVRGRDKPSVLMTTVNAALQRVPARDFVTTHALSVAPGNVIGMQGIVDWLELNGFVRASTVREPGEYAVRGGILDLYPPGMDMPVRLDFFGDALETIRTFDAQTQISEDQLRAARSGAGRGIPACHRNHSSISHRLCRAVRATTPDDLLYEAVSEGRRYPGMEHWLPLFHDKLETIFDYLPDTPLALEHLAEDAAHERFTQITDYYDARREALKQGATPPYKPLPPERLYLGEAEWKERLETSALARLTPFAVPETRRPRCRRTQWPQFCRRTRRARRQRVRSASARMCSHCRRPASALRSRYGAKARVIA